MTRMNWQTVEHWTADESGSLELYLLHVDDEYSKSWRVEWGSPGGPRRGATFAGPDREQKARAEFERRKTAYHVGWRQTAAADPQ